MKQIFLSLFIVLVSPTLTKCQSSPLDKRTNDYIGIRSAFDFNNRTQRKLLDSIDQLLIRIEQNNLYSLDIQAFHVLIDSVKYESRDAMILAKSRNEPDKKISYKSKVISFIEIFIQACDNELLELIQAFNSNHLSEIQTKASSVKAKLIQIQSVKEECLNADNFIRKKYKILVTDFQDEKNAIPN